MRIIGRPLQAALFLGWALSRLMQEAFQLAPATSGVLQAVFISVVHGFQINVNRLANACIEELRSFAILFG